MISTSYDFKYRYPWDKIKEIHHVIFFVCIILASIIIHTMFQGTYTIFQGIYATVFLIALSMNQIQSQSQRKFIETH